MSLYLYVDLDFYNECYLGICQQAAYRVPIVQLPQMHVDLIRAQLPPEYPIPKTSNLQQARKGEILCWDITQLHLHCLSSLKNKTENR